ncbi:hypothetical protein AAFN60_01950 [Roseibacillus persicicus]|uniref:hypothetical protein n=1 Tax=Roseibacillus persicicus TaxID=454148 RepID=UPI00398AE184
MNSDTLTKSITGHLATFVAGGIAWAVTNGYLDQAAADTLASGLEPVIEGTVALLVFLVTYFLQRFLRAKGLGGLIDSFSSSKSKLPLVLFFAFALCLLCPSCADYQVTGGLFARSDSAKGGLTFNEDGTATVSGSTIDAQGNSLGGSVTLSGK